MLDTIKDVILDVTKGLQVGMAVTGRADAIKPVQHALPYIKQALVRPTFLCFHAIIPWGSAPVALAIAAPGQAFETWPGAAPIRTALRLPVAPLVLLATSARARLISPHARHHARLKILNHNLPHGPSRLSL
jgi:hypothetical protein